MVLLSKSVDRYDNLNSELAAYAPGKTVRAVFEELRKIEGKVPGGYFIFERDFLDNLALIINPGRQFHEDRSFKKLIQKLSDHYGFEVFPDESQNKNRVLSHEEKEKLIKLWFK